MTLNRVARAAAVAFVLLCAAAATPAFAQTDDLMSSTGGSSGIAEPINPATMRSMFPYLVVTEPPAEPPAAAAQTEQLIIQVQKRTRVRSTPVPDRENLILFALQGDDPKKSHINATFGGINNAGGFVLGIDLTTADAIDDVELYADAAVSFFRFYYRLETGAIFGDVEKTGTKAFVRYRYTRRPQDNFFGLGPTAEQDPTLDPFFSSNPIGGETNYDREDRAGQAGLWWIFSNEIGRKFEAGVYAEVLSTSIYEGNDDTDPSIFLLYQPYFSGTQCLLPVFPRNAVPGLLGSRTLSYGAYLEYDGSNRYYGLPQGVYFYGRVASHDGLNDDADAAGFGGFNPYDFGWTQVTLDARGYIPLGGPRTSLALRLWTDLNEPKGGSAIPFYLQPYLGGGTSLRGFNTFRFRGENAFLTQIELRRTLWEKEGQAVELTFFGDAGQVWGRGFDADCPPDLIRFDPTIGEDFDYDNFEADFGAGVAYRLSPEFSLRIDFAHSNEGNRIRLGFTTGF